MIDEELNAARILWDYHQIDQDAQKSDVGIGLGSHDLGVAQRAAKLYFEGYFPVLLFTGANSPTTKDRFPDGEAASFAQYAIGQGVPESALIVEPTATNTSENFTKSRGLLQDEGLSPSSILVVCKPYMQRRAYLTCGKVWPEVTVTCASESMTLEEYICSIGSEDLVLSMLVGDTQRIEIYGIKGFALKESLSAEVKSAYDFLVRRGYTSRLLVDSD
ncbi:YdcF family protein [Acidithrix sp. C25]|uniref:YdcF family protein n=1 Tax=Acidithrix sp. C25 TaxID=1671482 RepID=UPI00191B8F9D|nr:YdcF family protein [Acidithrix sp. C25]CAG4927316.1 unnamed protein product [Acidithrix sp. C25]